MATRSGYAKKLRDGRPEKHVLVWAAVACAALTACHGVRDSPSLVVLVSVDTLRADHLGCYGYPRNTSPSLDRLAAEAIVFEQAFAHAPSTLVSHASLFASLIPHHHGASHAHRRALATDTTTLAETFLRAGWRTASINGGGQLAREFGVAQGFEVYDSVAREEDRFSRIVELGLRWLDEHDGQRRFLFLHTYEVHQPPDPPPHLLALFAKGPSAFPRPPDPTRRGRRPFSEQELAWYVDRYDAEIRSMDAAFGVLASALRRRGLWGDTLLVLTSDHGEELGERGRVVKHAHTLFDELLRVPLLVKLPGLTEGRRVTAPARLIDVAPTLLSAAGIAHPPAFEGADLLAAGSVPRTLIAQRDTATKIPVSAVRTADWKLLGRKLYDLGRDPHETVDVASRYPEVVKRLDRYQQQVVASGPAPETSSAEPSSATEDELRALGYLD